MLQANNLIAGKIVKGSILQKITSPINGQEITELNALSEEEIKVVLLDAKKNNVRPIKKNFKELENLAEFIHSHYDDFLTQIIMDAGFTEKDSKDLVNCTIEFCKDYEKHIDQIGTQHLQTDFSFNPGSSEKISFTSDAYGLIVATTPRNTPLITELTIIVHALWSGNSLVLRPSPGVAGTVALLINGISECFEEETLLRLNVIFGDARNFLEIGMDYADIVHYVGSSKYLENTLIAGIKKGVKVLVDGDGCSVIVVDKSVNVEKTVQACYEALIRCNAQICISVRGIIVDKSIYEEFKKIFVGLIKNTTIGYPDNKVKPDMGPLFSDAQANAIIEVAKKYDVLCGELKTQDLGSNYLAPIVLELGPNQLDFLRENVFGPIVGISSYESDDWKKWLTDNPINLTDAVFSTDEEFIEEFLITSKSPRRVVNIDPTVESVFEPWGAFLPSGWNDVSYWYHKYRNFYQLIMSKK